MSIGIIEKTLHRKGVLYALEKDGKHFQILFLHHSIERISKWNLAIEMVAETLLEPEEVLIGHNGRFIAHKCYGKHVVRAIYEYDNLTPALVTVYFPHKDRYFEGGGRFEDKILQRS